MITIYIDTTQGIMVSPDDDVDMKDSFNQELIDRVGNAAQDAFNEVMGIKEVMH